MSNIFAKKGEQVWNHDHTEGYEFTEDIIANTPSRAHQVKALGSARDPMDGDVMPEWLTLTMDKSEISSESKGNPKVEDKPDIG